MFIFYYCKKIDDNIFDEKIDVVNKNKLIEKYSLQYKNKNKEYWINNVRILSSEDQLKFNTFNDISLFYDNNYHLLNYEYICKECKGFSFYKTDLEDDYSIYDNKIDMIYICLKEYRNYLTIEFHCNNKSDFYKKKLLYNNIV